MSYPPDPNNPYAGGPSGDPYAKQQPGYGYPQQQPATQPGYGYGYPQYGGGPGMQPGMQPGMASGMPQGMPSQTVTARVLLFVAGSLWALLGIVMLIVGLAAEEALEDLDIGSGGAAVGVALILFLVFGGLGALHIVPAAAFGKGGSGSRVTAIIAASLNSLMGVLTLFSGMAEGNGATVVTGLLWAATAVTTVVFLSMRQSSSWFNRPRY